MSSYHIGILFLNFSQKTLDLPIIEGAPSVHTLVQLLHSSSSSSKKLRLHHKFLLQLCGPKFLCRIGSFLVCHCFQYIERSQALGLFFEYSSTHVIAMQKLDSGTFSTSSTALSFIIIFTISRQHGRTKLSAIVWGCLVLAIIFATA